MAQAECGLHYKDCEANNCSCSYVKRILGIPSAEAEWIPVSDELPKIGQKVLASTKRMVFAQVYKGVYSEPNVWHWGYNRIKVITAWMPLPKPYREDGELNV